MNQTARHLHHAKLLKESTVSQRPNKYFNTTQAMSKFS
jgi:hypothetical protein